MPASQQTDYPQRSVAIIKAILGGERDPRELAAYRDWRVKASEAEIAARLEGNRQEDVLFLLKYEFSSSRGWNAIVSSSSIWRGWNTAANVPICRKKRGEARLKIKKTAIHPGSIYARNYSAG